MRTQIFTAVFSFLFLLVDPVKAKENCEMQIDFGAGKSEIWKAVNDGVMGGLSAGGARLNEASLIFEGTLNTNGGGFSSIRHNINPNQLSSASSLALRLKPDGRRYRMTFRTNARYGWRPISFQADIPQSTAGDWAEVMVDFADLKASIFGRPVRGAEFDKTKIQEIGIIIADAKDGPFRLELDWIKSCE